MILESKGKMVTKSDLWTSLSMWTHHEAVSRKHFAFTTSRCRHHKHSWTECRQVLARISRKVQTDGGSPLMASDQLKLQENWGDRRRDDLQINMLLFNGSLSPQARTRLQTPCKNPNTGWVSIYISSYSITLSSSFDPLMWPHLPDEFCTMLE